jgi:hypothetical protein
MVEFPSQLAQLGFKELGTGKHLPVKAAATMAGSRDPHPMERETGAVASETTQADCLRSADHPT